MYWESTTYKGKRVYMKHGIYYEIALENLSKGINEKNKHENSENVGEAAVAAIKLQHHLCICTVFLYLTVESYINFYAVINEIGEREKLEKKPTKYKWRRYPKIVTKQEIDNKVVDNLEKLTIKRNELVHYKPNEGAEGIKDPTNITLADCTQYISIVISLFDALANIDESVKSEVERLENTKKSFFR